MRGTDHIARSKSMRIDWAAVSDVLGAWESRPEQAHRFGLLIGCCRANATTVT